MSNYHRKKQNKNDDSELWNFCQKWQVPENKYSFTQIPNTLIYCQDHLGLKDREYIVLVQLLAHWFTLDSKVYPSITRVGDFSGKKFSTAQRNLKSLEKKGFIKRKPMPWGTYLIDFAPCVQKVQEHVKICPHGLKKGSDNPAHLEYEHIDNHQDFFNSL